MPKPTTVEQYLSTFDEPALGHLQRLRQICTRAAPRCTEQLKWGHPAYIHPDGVIMFVFSGHKSHANMVFTPSTREAFADDLTGYQTGKGRLALPYDQPIPEGLLERMIAFRFQEFQNDGVRWK